MKITFNPIPFIGGLLAWHWFGWHLFVVCMLLTSGCLDSLVGIGDSD